MRTELADVRWKEVVSPKDKVNDQWVKLSSVLSTPMEQYLHKKSTPSHIHSPKFLSPLDQKAVKN